MIFFSNRNNENDPTSNKETCLSIVGFFLILVVIGGLTALIYGLITNSSSKTIGGAIVFGISLFLTILLILMIVFCLKNNNITNQP